MSEDFKKLDQMMKRNVPASDAELSGLILPENRFSWGKGVAVCASLILVVTVSQNIQQTNASDDLLALEEVMSLDITADDSIAEIDEAMEFME